ncbi:Tpr-related protein family member, putative [Theileria annulata]|uniref:Tpr-related protein family member, putative n=1 Tax=Theileria annulata TaxID=5874 RepID=Q4UBM1_THEAN|nr:Tpr-related protein family member, putative [Theileria annulata]CAI75780.1 Tpr-related protein family member, putative [Theileria annulata]|eukprot:XP_955256.1 Tpr-related protein family member, putative [Theileria annulata]
MVQCKGCTNQAGLEFAGGAGDKCWLLNAAYILAGLAMMLNIRLSYSSAPYALIRFKLPENLFTVFVRRMASALELWCLPSMLLETTKDGGLKLDDSGTKFDEATKPKAKPWKFEWFIVAPSILSQWLDFITYVVLLIIYVTGGDQGHETAYYGVIAISGFIFGINMPLVCAQEGQYITWYMIGENSFPLFTSLVHYFTTLIFGNRKKWNSEFQIVTIDIWVAIIISLVAAEVWTGAYLCELNEDTATGIEKMLHIHAEDFDARNTHGDMVTPTFMVIVGMGLLIAHTLPLFLV